jgi:hypothetical protein
MDTFIKKDRREMGGGAGEVGGGEKEYDKGDRTVGTVDTNVLVYPLYHHCLPLPWFSIYMARTS